MGWSARWLDRSRRQEEEDAGRRGRTTLERNWREVQEERQSEQTGHALGRAWPSQASSSTAKLTRKYSEGLQSIDEGQTQKQEGFLNPDRTNKRENSFLQEEKTRKGWSARWLDRSRRQEEEDAGRRGRTTLERNWREMQEERRS
ncbi:hypothetical protein NDU88_001676 [Pleurodeles waltl]|uniref:Uncharacterized protein n=1 Tax=Pleurodeles waltl TaxID=8319 RepID=A0AAV7P4I3_PLEWA|nr:hypothetical protein NDU88_001676 [Pleurodeles waltl]